MTIIDFETASDLELTEVGNRNYVNHPSTRILMMAYKVDDEPTKQWFPGMPLPQLPRPLYAFNAEFEWSIWNRFIEEADWMQFRDVQALCGRYGLPQNLMQASLALKVPVTKDTYGKQLIKLFCMPPYATKESHPAQWKLFCEYNCHDVEATYGVLKALPVDDLEPTELKIYCLNHEINARGIPVAVEEARVIQKVTSVYMEESNDRLPLLTNGMVSKITQVKRIKDWLATKGVTVDSLDAKGVGELLEQELPEDVAEVLEMRAGLGLSSLGKYIRIIKEAYNGRMYNNSRYYGAHTGRITGMGLQLLNMPRAQAKDPDAEIEKFKDFSICDENPVMSARSLVRSMIKAPEGKVIMAADYSSIEYVLLMWLVGETRAVQRFADKYDQYKDLAVHMFHVPYEEITKDQRQIGKYGVLGCGYGLGAQGFVGYADRFGLKIPFDMAKKTVDGFRALYGKVPEFWYALDHCAKTAIESPARDFTTNRVTFRKIYDRNRQPWLRMMLPSGRAMYYKDPRIEVGRYGENVTSMGLNQVTKQWQRKYMTPGKWAENVIQALGRDLLYYDKFCLKEAGYHIIFSVYDEVVVEEDKDFADLDSFIKTFTTLPPWAEGLPLRADGYISNRYKKG